MMRIALVLTLCIGATTAARAGGDFQGIAYDAPADQYDWTGYFVGVHGGHLSGETSNVTNFPFALEDWSGSGWFGGVQGGYRYQFPNNWVIGAGVTVPVISEEESLTVFGNVSTAEMQGSVRGGVHVGYAMGRFMPFVTAGGGAAWVRAREVLANGTVSPWVENTHSLGTLGFGVQYALSERWTAGISYNKVWTSRERYDCGPAVCGIVGEFDLEADTVTGTLEWRFWSGR